MPRPSALTERTTLSGFVHSDDPSQTPPSQKFDLGRLQQQLVQRAPSDVLISDGTTTNRRIEWRMGAVGNVAGSALTVPFEFQVPATNPSVAATVYGIGDSGSTDLVTRYTGAFSITILNNGILNIRQTGSTAGSIRQIEWTGFRATYSGLWVRGAVVVPVGNSTVTPSVYVNGVDITANFTSGTANTPPNWLDSTMLTTYHVAGYNWPAGQFRPWAPINRAWSFAEYLEWFNTGRLPAADIIGGTVQALTTAQSGFEDGLEIWSQNWAMTASRANSTEFARSGSRSLKCTINATGGASGAIMPNSVTAPLGVGSVEVEGYYYIPSGQSGVAGVLSNWTAGAFGPDEGTGWWNGSGVTAGGALVFDTWIKVTTTGLVRAFGANGRLRFGLVGPANGVYYLDDVTVKVNGALSAPVIQSVQVLDDATQNGQCGLVVGFSPQTSRKDWRIVARTHTSSVHDEQLLGGALFLDPTRHRIDEWTCLNSSGAAVNLQYGSASGGSQYLASTSVAAGYNDVPPATRFTQSNSIWARRVAGAGVGPFTHTIRGHRVGGA